MADVEDNTPKEGALAVPNVTVINDLSDYPGSTIEEKVDSFLAQHAVVVISKPTCPFCLDVKDLLGNVIGVQVHVIEASVHPQGSAIHK